MTTFGEIRAEVPSGGLFDVALDPDFGTEPSIYLSYSARSDDGLTTKVVRARLMGDTRADLQTLLVAEPFAAGEFFHFGGYQEAVPRWKVIGLRSAFVRADVQRRLEQAARRRPVDFGPICADKTLRRPQ